MQLTDGGRLLTRTEQLLADFLDDPRAAIALSPHVYIPDVPDPTPFIEAAVINTFVAALEEVHGPDTLVYVGGERRDTLRQPTDEAVSRRPLA